MVHKYQINQTNFFLFMSYFRLISKLWCCYDCSCTARTLGTFSAFAWKTQLKNTLKKPLVEMLSYHFRCACPWSFKFNAINLHNQTTSNYENCFMNFSEKQWILSMLQLIMAGLTITAPYIVNEIALKRALKNLRSVRPSVTSSQSNKPILTKFAQVIADLLTMRFIQNSFDLDL
jgi:hypothetical protein